MQRQLPVPFINRMQQLLGEQYQTFHDSYSHSAWHGLRVNPLKIDTELLREMVPFSLRPVPWCAEGFYYSGEDRPGKHPYHSAGLYYLQEPSAMSVAAALAAQPGEVVLDLCAAPGGKSTQLTAALQGEGLLISNEIHPIRAKALSENIERLGITNALVTNETPERLAMFFPHFFDRILVDAPCSGEGMFRKLPEAIDDWSEAKVLKCHLMQVDILEAAHAMLKPGGAMVYSTCTFAPLENEITLAKFLDAHPEYVIETVPHASCFSPGHPDWAPGADPSLAKSARLWPHLLEGEGHFVAKLTKSLEETESAERLAGSKRQKGKKQGKQAAAISKEALAAWATFAKDAAASLEGRVSPDSLILFGEQLYHLPQAQLPLEGLKIVRAGWHLGTVKKNRMEPSHALALALRKEDVSRSINFSADDPMLLRYLKGESVTVSGKNGWTLVTVDGFSLGWGKMVDGQLKNHYPKGLRWL
ncbi:RsmF rRNA methyltransferase first C-terminal domain-containing protein [Brevibacillus sp. SYSU BS000544]|uniref:RsmF rRNA methyltransferase first C-terminal domain-containing protein n=1 Tax=Brevibacillus sp. SYSU BS000544 TaxID=3416443 RepID=UPI003CE47442